MGLTYVSRMFGGCASDKHITMQSKDLIDNLRYGGGECRGCIRYFIMYVCYNVTSALDNGCMYAIYHLLN